VAQQDSPIGALPSPHSRPVSQANSEKLSHVPGALHGVEGPNQPLAPSFRQHTVPEEHHWFAPQRMPGSGAAPASDPEALSTSESRAPGSIAASSGEALFPSNTRHRPRNALAPMHAPRTTRRIGSWGCIGILSVQIGRGGGRRRHARTRCPRCHRGDAACVETRSCKRLGRNHTRLRARGQGG
jgi:hypothetical protein